MSKLQELREQRATIVNNARKNYDLAVEKAKAENRDASAGDEAALDTAMNAVADLDKQIATGEEAERKHAANLERLKGAEASLNAVNRGPLAGVAGSAVNGNGFSADPANAERDNQLAMKGWFLNQYGEDVPDACVEAGRRCGINPHAKFLDLKLSNDYGAVQREYVNTLSSNNPAGGGILRLGSVLGPLEQAMLNFGPMLQVAQVIRTDNANPLPWPTANDTSNTGRQIGENVTVQAATDPTFAAMVLGAYKFTSDLIKVPYELLRDNSINLAALVGTMLGERLGRVQNTKFTLGTGAATIYGIVPRSTLGKTAAANNAITADELIDLEHSVPSAYRPGSEFMFNDTTLKVIRKLKSNDNQYLWQPGLQQGVAGSILGAGYRINDDMASIAASAKVALFGQLNRYKVRQVGRIRLYRLEERFRDTDQDGFVAFIECDGNLLDAGMGPIRHLALNT